MTRPARRPATRKRSAGVAHDATATRCGWCGGWRIVGRACRTCTTLGAAKDPS